MKILRVKKFPLYDIFFDNPFNVNGWLDWSRYLYQHGKLLFIAGIERNNKERHAIKQQIESFKDNK